MGGHKLEIGIGVLFLPDSVVLFFFLSFLSLFDRFIILSATAAVWRC